MVCGTLGPASARPPTLRADSRQLSPWSSRSELLPPLPLPSPIALPKKSLCPLCVSYVPMAAAPHPQLPILTPRYPASRAFLLPARANAGRTDFPSPPACGYWCHCCHLHQSPSKSSLKEKSHFWALEPMGALSSALSLTHWVSLGSSHLPFHFLISHLAGWVDQMAFLAGSFYSSKVGHYALASGNFFVKISTWC